MMEGWHLWADGFSYDAPLPGCPIAIKRKEWPNEYIVLPEELRPEMNVAGLWWRPWPYDQTSF